MASKIKWIQREVNAYDEPFHFFASSAADWRTGTNLEEVIRQMKSLGYPFNLFKVHLPATAAYKISRYQPDVPDEQLDFIAFYDIERA